MLPRTLVPLLCSVLSLGLVACGSGLSTPSSVTLPAPPTTLNGNWSLAGARLPATYPLLSTSLHVQGSQLTGRGIVLIQCSSAAPLGVQISGGFDLSGQVAADGTFTATYSSPTLPTPALAYTVTLSGSSPTAASPNTWTGTYTVTASLPAVNPPLTVTPCAYSQAATFTATPIAALTGTYSGTVPSFLVASGPVLSPGVALTLQVAQQPATLVTQGVLSAYQLPLTGTLNVTGSTCFTSGSTASAQFPGQITGDIFQLTFLMNDGSQLFLAGNLNDLTAASLSVSAIVMGGSCPNVSGVATLIRY